MHDATFLLGRAFRAAIGNGLMLGYLLFLSGLVPRRYAQFGMVAGFLALLTAILVLFGAYDQVSTPAGILALPEAVWEFSLGIYLIVKGFRPDASLSHASGARPEWTSSASAWASAPRPDRSRPAPDPPRWPRLTQPISVRRTDPRLTGIELPGTSTGATRGRTRDLGCHQRQPEEVLMSSTQMNTSLREEDRSTTTVSGPPSSRRTVRSFTSYTAAERAVDQLSDEGFPVEHVGIVGTGLRYVEQVSGRLTTGRAAVAGLGQGGMLGLFWGLLFSLFFTTDSAGFFGVLAFSVVVGIVLGGLLGAVAHVMTGGRRDFDSVAQTRADHYEVQVDDGFAGEAERLLERTPSR